MGGWRLVATTEEVGISRDEGPIPRVLPDFMSQFASDVRGRMEGVGVWGGGVWGVRSRRFTRPGCGADSDGLVE